MPRLHRLVPAICVITITLALAAYGDEKLAGRAARSVHLGYSGPESTAFYNEITVEKSADGTYFAVCGFNHGYYGIQQLGDGRKVLIFSIWDPGKQDDPKAVDEEKRVKLIHKDEKVRIGRFGGEGTGGQSFLDYDWQVGQTYRFLVTAKLEGERTVFAAHFFIPEEKAWKHLVSFSTITGGKPLAGYYSFIEDFKRNRVSLTHERRAAFGNGWIRDKENTWRALTQARFTADSNPATNIDAGRTGTRFFLATGGEVKNDTAKLNESIKVAPVDLPAGI